MRRVTITGSKGYSREIVVGTQREWDERFAESAWVSLNHAFKLGIYGDLRIFSHINWDDVARMADMEIYDFSVPQQWFDANKDSPEFEDRHYVWSYDGEKNYHGNPVSLSQMLMTVVYPKILYELTKGDD